MMLRLSWEETETMLKQCWDEAGTMLRQCCVYAMTMLRRCWDGAEMMLRWRWDNTERMLRWCWDMLRWCKDDAETMGGFICSFSLFISFSITSQTSKFRNHQFTISSKYFDMVCYLKRETYSGPIYFEVQRNDIWTENIQSFAMPF